MLPMKDWRRERDSNRMWAVCGYVWQIRACEPDTHFSYGKRHSEDWEQKNGHEPK